ncbi:hypothetical protein NL676_039250 [Syzygium grande]|nr:hypothetical protein NL676_039250 [Syzygium grande]
MKSASPSKRVSTRGKKMHRIIMLKQLERDQKMQRIHDDLELAIGDENVDVVETLPEKAMLVKIALNHNHIDAHAVSGQCSHYSNSYPSILSHQVAKSLAKIDLATIKRMVPRAVMPKQSQRDRGTQRSRNGFEGIEKEMNAKKERELGWRKAGYVLCKDREAEKERDDGSGFHCCARNDPVIVRFRTKAGSIGCPLEKTPGQVSRIAERTGWTPWSWQWPCVHARLGISYRC